MRGSKVQSLEKHKKRSGERWDSNGTTNCRANEIDNVEKVMREKAYCGD